MLREAPTFVRVLFSVKCELRVEPLFKYSSSGSSSSGGGGAAAVYRDSLVPCGIAWRVYS